MRLIDADTFSHRMYEEVFDKDNEYQRYDFGCWIRYKLFEMVLGEEPTVDAVEVIRCAECKWFQCNMSMDGYLPEGVNEFECRHWCGSCDPVDFCSFAERRKDD